MTAFPGSPRNAQIIGWGTALPDKVLHNRDLEQMMDTSHEWIVERTGIHERRVGGSTAGLSVISGRQALQRAGVDPASIDVLILATTTPDRTVPATSASVQTELGLRCGAMDVNAACSGFVYGLVVAHGMIAMGAERVLLIGTDTLSRITDWTDRNTAILFADGSGAAVIEASDAPDGGRLLGWHLDADGTAEPYLYCDVGGTIHMDGKEVFRRAVRIMVESGRQTLAQAGVDPADVALVVPHQANIRIIQAACERLGIPLERAATVLHYTGNSSAASIPLALGEALNTKRVRPGDLVLLCGFGAGMTAASVLLRWGTET